MTFTAKAFAAAAPGDEAADDMAQMLLAMGEEVRVIVVKLADRLHNMRTLDFMPAHKQRLIAQETLDVFAPLAGLLGMDVIKKELEQVRPSHTGCISVYVRICRSSRVQARFVSLGSQTD